MFILAIVVMCSHGATDCVPYTRAERHLTETTCEQRSRVLSSSLYDPRQRSSGTVMAFCAPEIRQ